MARPTKKQRNKAAAPHGSEFIRRDEVNRNLIVLTGALDRAIEFHRTNHNDPHGVGNSVIAALTEVRDAFKAYGPIY